MLVNCKVSNGHSRLRKDDEKMTKNTVNLGNAAAHSQNDLPQSTVKYNYCQLLSKYKNQENALTGGLLALFGASLHLVWGLWEMSGPNVGRIFMLISFHLAWVIGSLVSASLIHKRTKKRIYYLSGCLLAASSILFIVFRGGYAAILCGRMLAGMAHGLSFTTVLVHVGEISSKEIRGFLITSIGYFMMFFGFMVSIPFSNTWWHNDLVLGIIGLVLAIMALVMTPYQTNESVTWLLRNGNEQEALDTLIRLRGETLETAAIRNDLEELKLMVTEDFITTHRDNQIFNNGNWQPLLAITAIRMLTLFTSNLVILMIAVFYTRFMLFEPNEMQNAVMVLLGVRIGLSIVPVFLSDKWGRKSFITISGIISGLTLVPLAVYLHWADSAPTSGVITQASWLPGTLITLFYLTASFGFDHVGNVYVAEAFSLKVKAWSITFATGVEQMFHCIFIALFISTNSRSSILVMVYLTAISMIGLSIWLHSALPETRMMSLRQCRNEFNKSLATVSYTGNRYDNHFAASVNNP